MSNKTALATAIIGAILGLEKLKSALENSSDELVYENNDAAAGLTNDTPVELDDEGIPWDERIHAGSKGKVASKLVKKGQAWRRRKGIEDDEYEAVYNELKSKFAGVADESDDIEEAPSTPSKPAGPSKPGKPGAPSKPSKPAGPSKPGKPGKPAVSKTEGLRKAIVVDLLALNDRHGFDHNDAKEALVDEFDIAQNDDAKVVFGSFADDQFQPVYDFFHSLLEQYEACADTVKEIKSVMNDDSYVNEGLEGVYGNFNTDQLGGVHYSQVNECLEMLKTWKQECEEWVADQNS